MILRPFEFLYHILSDIKNVLYDFQVLSTKNIPVPVISIGNLSFGGTGKTPFIELIANELKDMKIAIVCRSYKVDSRQPQKIDILLKNAAQSFGDEAVLLQRRLPAVSVWSGPVKWQTCQAAFEFEQPQVILVDDGFSHRKLRRNFDLVLFDATRIGTDFFREGLWSLKRAQAVVLTKTQLASEAKIDEFKTMLVQKFPHLEDSIFDAQSHTQLDFPPEFPMFVFCGIANPESFRQNLLASGYSIQVFESYADHQNYNEDLQQALVSDFERALKKNPNLKLVTTEKDFVKINSISLLKQVHVAAYEVQMINLQKERLLEKIRQNF